VRVHMGISDIAQIGPIVSARERILTTAYRLFTRRGIRAVGTDEVIVRSGVAKATLYRHFPTREDLILAVYRHDMQQLADSVGELLKTHSPLDAFLTWFETLAAYIRIKHGLDQALHGAAIRSAIDESYAPVAAAVTRLLDACVADGSVRFDPKVGPNHHHLVCDDCGLIYDVDPRGVEGLFLPRSQRYGMAIDSVEVVFHGRCSACAEGGIGDHGPGFRSASSAAKAPRSIGPDLGAKDPPGSTPRRGAGPRTRWISRTGLACN